MTSRDRNDLGCWRIRVLTFCPGENRIEFQTPLPRGGCRAPASKLLGRGPARFWGIAPQGDLALGRADEPEINVHPALRHEPGTWTYDAYLAVLAEDHGDQAEARRIWRKVFDACSDNPEALSRGEA